MQIPEGYQSVMPYLIITNAGRFIDFTKEVFDAVEVSRDMQEDGKTIRHAMIQIGGSSIMMGEAMGDWKPLTASLFVYIDEVDARYAAALAAGSETLMGVSDQPYGRTCGVKDPFGNVWWITTPL